MYSKGVDKGVAAHCPVVITGMPNLKASKAEAETCVITHQAS